MKLRFSGVLILLSLFSVAKDPADYSGENMLAILGTPVNSREFKDFKQYWWLNKNFENYENGIKLFVNTIHERTEGVLLAGENFEFNGTKFSKCNTVLPYGISWEDDTASLFAKLENGQKLIGKSALKFYKDDVGIEVSFTDLRNGSISSIQFYKENRNTVARLTEPAPVVKKESLIEVMRAEGRAQIEQPIKPLPVKESVVISDKYSPFKKSILSVFKSYKESNFYSIKQSDCERRNFWNYKYTYNTTLKIEGEKFNMLYSFPFPTSQLDFVSVIKEADNYDKSFETAYKEFEKKLMKNFPESEGWVSSCIPGNGKKVISDLEFRNDKYGSIILDYCRNPNGRHVLYLRFLLYSD